MNPNYKAYPGFTTVLPENAYAEVHTCGTDADGNMWMFFTDPSGVGKDFGIDLYCWPSSERNKALTHQDVAQGGLWEKLFFTDKQFVKASDLLSSCIALKHPANRNKLVVFYRCTSSVIHNPIVIVDHKGTLDDSSDDEVSVLQNFATPTGLLVNSGYINALIEDPVSGDIIADLANNIVRFNPNSPITNNTIEAKIINISNRDGSTTPIVQNQSTNSLSFDEYNRLWIGTSNDGVYGISANHKNVIAHYTTDNSPLQSNQINDVCWNPDTQELFIATEGGIMSMNPYTPKLNDGQIYPSIEPTSVTPNFAGVIQLNNIPDGSSIIIEDENGKKVSTPHQVSNSQSIWDTCDYNGNLVPSGIYFFHDLSGYMDDIKISIVR